MAYRCTIGEHSNCSACGQFVAPAEPDHVHIYRGRGKPTNTLCGQCWLFTALGARRVLNAIWAAGIRFKDTATLKSYLDKHVQIGLDLPFELSPARTN